MAHAMPQPYSMRQWQAAGWHILSCLCYALMNGGVRYLTGGSNLGMAAPLPPATIALFQNFFGLILLWPFFGRDWAYAARFNHLGIHMLRAALAVAGVVLWYMALRVMPIAQAISLSFAGPVFTVLGAYIVLKEHLGLLRLMAIGCSFLGAFLVLQPGTVIGAGGMDFQSLWAPLLSGVSLAGVKICGRLLALRGETSRAMTASLMLFMLPASWGMAMMEGMIWPHSSQWGLLIGLGLLSACAHLATAQAYKKGEVTFVMPFGISKLILSAGVGYWAFGEYPQMWTVFLGATIMVVSTVLLGLQTPREEGKNA